jgi:hypothetical protein
MKPPTFGPPLAAPDDVVARLIEDGYAIVDGAALAASVHVPIAELATLTDAWFDLPPDRYLKDGGAYRRRRHACYLLDEDRLVAVPHRAHWQPLEYNALHGGMRRWFEPIAADVVENDAWRHLIAGLGMLFARVHPVRRWFVEAHQFRIDTANGIGRPTPEGAHRDGVDFVAVILVARRGVKGGETRVFDAAGPQGSRFTMEAPWTALLLDDARVIHETTPVQPSGDAAAGTRDTLVLTYRSDGFQGDGP